MQTLIRLSTCVVVAVLLVTGTALAQTGKIAGTVTDASTGDPLPGVNVVIEGTSIGAVTDLDGYYDIINVSPGTYTVQASFIGFSPLSKQDVRVNIDLTTDVNFELQDEAVGLAEIVVSAERPVVRRDVAHSQATISEEQILETPSTGSVRDLTLLMPGIELGGGYMEGDSYAFREGISIRGGKVEETGFFVDGHSTKDARQGIEPMNLSMTSIEEVQVITGGFNAEYGDIRSGLVNVVTKNPSFAEGIKLDAIVEYTPSRTQHWGEPYYSYDNERSVLYPYLGPESMEGFTWNGDVEWIGWNEYASNLPEEHPYHNDPEAAREQFAWESRPQDYGDDPDVNVDATVTGPVPGLPNAGFMISNIFDQRDIPYNSPLPVHRNNTTHAKLFLTPIQNLRVTLFGEYGRLNSVSSAYRGIRPGSYWLIEDPSHLMSLNNHFWNQGSHSLVKHTRRRAGADLTYTLNDNAFVKVSGQYSWNDFWAGHAEKRDMSCVKEIDTRNGQTVCLDDRPYGHFDRALLKNVLGYYVAGHGTRRDDSSVNSLTLSADYTSQFNRYNQVKVGIQFSQDAIQNRWGQHRTEKSQKREWFYDAKPMLLSGYVQDKLEFKGMVANVGLRLDYSDPADEWFVPDEDDLFTDWFREGIVTYTDDYMYNEEGFTDEMRVDSFQYRPTAPVEPKVAVSPRVGVSHPITDNSKIFFNYGHFYQRVPHDRMFMSRLAGINTLEVTDWGNPNLDFEKTVAYELGAEQNLFGSKLRVTGYYKDVTNEIININYNGYRVDYNMPANRGYRDIRGVEVALEKMAGRWFRGFVSYDYRILSQGRIGERDVYEDPDERPRIYDPRQTQPVATPKFRLNLVFDVPEAFGPSLGTFHPLGEWYFNVLYRWDAGRYFTYNPAQIEGIENNMRWVDVSTTDLRIGRDLNIDKGVNSVRLFVEVRNLFNQKFILYPPDGETIPSGQWSDYLSSLQEGDRVGEYDTEAKPYLDVPRNEQLLFTNRPREFSIGMRLGI